jgi:DHA1 family bicyclomycin/chloramphenicol resistance-like MFS transporter
MTVPSRPPLWLLVLITISGTMAMHMFVPALPDAARGLRTTAGEMQMAISIYIIGLACGQLVYGPLSDAYGRRPTLIWGLGLYAAGGLAAALAPNLATLLVARLVQALGGCAGLALGRAIVRDTSAPEGAIRQLALLNLMVMVGPGLAPMVGGAVSAGLGWRAIFLVLAGAGAVTMFFAWRRLPETGHPTGRFGPRVLLRDYAELLRSPRFVGYALGGGTLTTCIYAFLAAFPFILTNDLHEPVHAVGVYAGIIVFGMGIGNALTSRLIRRVPAEILLRIGNGVCLAAACVYLGMVITDVMAVWSLIIAMLFLTTGLGMTSPVALGKAISVEPRLIGSAAGLYGFSQMASGAIATSLAALGDDPALASAVVLVGAGVVALVGFRVAMRAERRASGPAS